MKKVKITVMRMACYRDLMAEYENPIEDACSMRLGETPSRGSPFCAFAARHARQPVTARRRILFIL